MMITMLALMIHVHHQKEFPTLM
jgi:hypothetical protein